MHLFDCLSSGLGQTIIGWLISDFLTGLVHWWQDRIATTTMPIVGPKVIKANRLHHIDPLAFTHSSIIERNLALWIVVSVLSVIWFLVWGPSIVLAMVMFGGFLTGEVHVWTHTPLKVSPFISILQEIGVIQSPKHHLGHHRDPQDIRYCTLTDFLNPILDGIGFWDSLEKVFTWIGLPPNKGTK